MAHGKVKGRRLMGEINVVPYIDVMLVLLIIFMITAPLLTQGIKVELPSADAEPLDPDLTEDNAPLILTVKADGSMYIGGGDEDESEPMSEQQVVVRAAAVLKRKPEKPVLVRADKHVEYGIVVTGMVLLQRAGALKVGFITDPAGVPEVILDES